MKTYDPMRIAFFIFSAIILIFSSCQKEVGFPKDNSSSTDSSSSYYIKCKIDGVARTFNFEDTAAITKEIPILGNNRLDIQGFASPDEDNLEGIGVAIHFDLDTLGIGTYKLPDYAVFAGYTTVNDPTIMYVAGLHDSPPIPLSITITSITDKEVTGTFECTMYKAITDEDGNIISVGDEYKTFTEGEFKVPLGR